MAQDEPAVMDIIEAKRRDEWSFVHATKDSKYSSARSAMQGWRWYLFCLPFQRKALKDATDQVVRVACFPRVVFVARPISPHIFRSRVLCQALR